MRRKAKEIQDTKLKIAELERGIAEALAQPTREERFARQAEIKINSEMLSNLRTQLTELTSDYAKMSVSAEADAKSEAERLLGDQDFRLYQRHREKE